MTSILQVAESILSQTARDWGLVSRRENEAALYSDTGKPALRIAAYARAEYADHEPRTSSAE